MSSKILVLVTCGNQGLGYCAIQQLSATNILMGSRDLSKAEKAIKELTDDKSANTIPSNVEAIKMEMSSDESIYAAAKPVEEKYCRLDILMPNAGIAYTHGTLREQYRKIFDTNLFGAAITVEAFLPLLKKSTVPGGKRIAFTSSGLASIAYAVESESNYSAVKYPVYGSTKTAMSMIMLGYARGLESEGFVVSASDPGYCATNLNNHSGLKDPREGAKALIRAAVASKEEVHGALVDETSKLPW